MKPLELLKSLFRRWAGTDPSHVTMLAGAGSSRRYYRLFADVDSRSLTAIGVEGDNPLENKAFIALSRSLGKHGLPVPEVYAAEGMCYLQQDLGSTDLLSYILKGEADALPEQVMAQLARMQTLPPDAWRPEVVFPDFGPRLVMWDLNYFKYEFLKPSGALFDEDLLEDDFCRLASRLSSLPPERCGFMWRDCQSRNVMVFDGTPWFIDFQSGRLGPSLYDAVSFAWQAKARFSPEYRLSLLSRYADAYCSLRSEQGVSLTPGALLSDLGDIVLLRLLQVLGAYGLRGLVEHKAHFIESIPPALDNLADAVRRGWLDPYPELKRVAGALVDLPRFSRPPSDGRLHIKVFSFSYKKGYPEDLSGNGGGFMFDCRGMHNPGRYDRYKPLTGLDAPVIEFLEERGEVQRFLAYAREVVYPTVRRYIDRGFTSLQVGFGCTGGRHRSVYCAEHFADALTAEFPETEVEIIHREHNVSKCVK